MTKQEIEKNKVSMLCISAEQHQALKIMAAKQGLTMLEIAKQAINAFLIGNGQKIK